ncbi:hypothetical protein GLOIN_2v1761305 [Rhizophagus irregularis DAOM 181602=DAOM 197198]|uniref:Uncharacterized protein n=1 Tax=Rhizophagus irregularis (strain DAOM 197198w) TaxID=1432141 RepID=A0A015JZI3_RHIIW|nr:hypothetical protein RirG_066200 [Rhizophagus irregularis DAOM 197198w]GBC12790.1 hypothetical protein GLOIN_2v1761305 [Rhizophagus irregularis DAOM 181602=DAOM 197198]
MVFQSTLPISINEMPKEIRELNADTPLFGMTLGMRVMQNKVDSIFERLLNFKMSKSENLSYNKNLDVEIIEKEIITQCDFGCLIPPPNVVILTPTGSPNDDNKIFCITQMYKEEFSLNDNKYLDICADVAIFRRLIKSHARWKKIRPILGQWHTSKNMLNAIVDYRSTRRILELVWVATGIAIHIYAKIKNIGIEEILTGPTDQNICIKAWYFYYQYFTIWKSHLIGICIGNYNLQRNSLTAFAPLFPVTGKNNYTTSVVHFLSILKKYLNLERKFQYCASINLARKGHYPAFDEALKTYGIGYIKQNIIGNIIDQENLNLQI